MSSCSPMTTLMQKELQEMAKRLAMDPALPGDKFEFNQEP